jgi:hypothetical protein
VAVVASRGVLYAVADYAHAVSDLSPAQVENAVARLVQAQGISILNDPTAAREYCAQPRSLKGGDQPKFMMLWQGSDLSRLPQQLVDQIATGRYRQAAVGSCSPKDQKSSFTAYHLAVLLY